MIIIKITRHNQMFLDAIKEDPACMAEPLKGHFELLKKLKDEGKYLGGYYLPGDGRSIQIFNFEDEAELDKNYFEDPMSHTFDMEILPGVNLLDHIQHALDMEIDPEK